MSGRLVGWALHHPQVFASTRTERCPNGTDNRARVRQLVWLCLAEETRDDGDGLALVAKEEVAVRVQADVASVRRALRDLRARQLLVEPRGSVGGRGNATWRRLTPRWCEPGSDCAWCPKYRPDASRSKGGRADPLTAPKGGRVDPLPGGYPQAAAKGGRVDPLSPGGSSQRGAGDPVKGGRAAPPSRLRENPTNPGEVPHPRARPAASAQPPASQQHQPRRARLVEPQPIGEAVVAIADGRRPPPPPTAERRWREEADKRAAAQRLLAEG